jgi:hypothetical protein
MSNLNIDDLDDKLVQIDWEKKNGYWDWRVRNYMWPKLVAIAIMFALIYGLALVISSNKDKEIALTWGIIKKGDNLYLKDEFITDSTLKILQFSRMIRPITTEEINAMKISVAEKRKMLAELDTSKNETIMLDQSDVVILRDKIFKYGTALAGHFVEKDSTTKVYESVSSLKTYGIIPNPQLLDKGYKFQIPKGYVLANNFYYLMAGDLALTEPEVMKKFKPKAAPIANIPVTVKKATDPNKIAKQKTQKKHKHKKRSHHLTS